MDSCVIGSSEQVFLGLGNGMIARYKKSGLAVEEVQQDVHNAQITSLAVSPDGQLLFTAALDNTFAIHKTGLDLKPAVTVKMTLLRVKLDTKPTELAIGNFS